MEPTFADRQSADLRPNRTALAALAALAGALGTFPYLLYAGWWSLSVAAGLVFGLVALRKSASLETDATDPPSKGEWFLAGWAAVGQGLMPSFAGFLFYGVAYGIAALAACFGWLDQAQRHIWGFWAGFVMLVLVSPVFAGMVGESLGKWLYDRPAGVRTPFSPILSEPFKVRRVSIGGLVVFGVLVAFSDPPSLFFCVGLTLILFYTALPLIFLTERKLSFPLISLTERESSDTQVEERLEAFLQSRGYRTLAHPRTRKPEVDPLILGIDLLAWSDDGVYAIEVKRRAPKSEPVEGAEAYGIRRASSVIRHELPIPDRKEWQVTPVLVLVGGSVGDSLAEFSREENVRVAYVADAAFLEGTSDDPAHVTEVFNAVGLPIPATSGAAARGGRREAPPAGEP